MQRTLDGLSLADKAVELLRDLEPKDGYWLAFSGGKDSICVKRLCDMAGVKYEAHYSVTTVDPPELIYYMREHHPGVVWDRPEHTMFGYIANVYRGPPLRQQRWCCRHLKESCELGRTVLTGIRWAESNRRARRTQYEPHRKGGARTFFLHPIISWTDSDVWDFIRERGLPYCRLYDEGFKRLGCVMCPQQGQRGMRRDAARWPGIARAYKRALQRALDNRRERNGADDWAVLKFADGQAWFDWWVGQEGPEAGDCQMPLFDN